MECNTKQPRKCNAMLVALLETKSLDLDAWHNFSDKLIDGNQKKNGGYQ